MQRDPAVAPLQTIYKQHALLLCHPTIEHRETIAASLLYSASQQHHFLHTYCLDLQVPVSPKRLAEPPTYTAHKNTTIGAMTSDDSGNPHRDSMIDSHQFRTHSAHPISASYSLRPAGHSSPNPVTMSLPLFPSPTYPQSSTSQADNKPIQPTQVSEPEHHRH